MGGDVCDLKVHINGHHTFFLNQRILCSFSARLKKMVRQEKRRNPKKAAVMEIKIEDFPGGPLGFELASRFCANNGRVAAPITPSNICILHSSAFALQMTEEASASNLLAQAETFLDGLFYWTWDEILTALKSCEPFSRAAHSSGLLPKLISSLVSKISDNSEAPLACSPSSCSSSPDTARSSSFAKEWWFDGLTILAPSIIEGMVRALGAYGADNKSLVLTRFLLHYLRRVVHGYRPECGGLAETAVSGVVAMGRAAFSCRGMFRVLRIVSGFSTGKECRQALERVIGLAMDQATLDDLLVSGRGEGGVYDVSLVMRLVRVFVDDSGVALHRLKKVGWLVDKYLGEISPDPSLKVSKFLGVAQSLPDSARDCFDGVYRALDIYLESHPALSSEERTRLCRCLNYEKLTLEACKDLAQNQRIPPGAAIHAMVCQQARLSRTGSSPESTVSSATATPRRDNEAGTPEPQDGKEELRMNLQKMQNRVVELEKVCTEMKSQMSKMAKGPATRAARQRSRGLAKLC